MKRSTKQLLSVLLVIAMMASLLVVPTAVAADATPVTHTFTASQLDDVDPDYGVTDEAKKGKGYGDQEPIAATEMESKFEGYFSVTGDVKKRATKPQKDKNGVPDVAEDQVSHKVKSVEVAKDGGSSIDFTVEGTATVTVNFSSTGSSNASDIALYKGDVAQTNKDGATVATVTGTTGSDVVFENLEAGTYSVMAKGGTNSGDVGGRATRVYTITVVETPAAEEPSDEPSDEPSTEPSTPASTAPASTAPASSAPASTAPASTAPASSAPASQAPASQAPASQAPASQAPASQAPASQAPASQAPASQAPASQAPAANDTWTAAANNVPGGTPDLVEETTGAVVEKELLVTDKVDGVEFYVGGGSTAAGNTKDSKYKFKEGCLMGDADAESAVGTKMSASRGYEAPVAGTYFKWVAKKAGILTVVGDYNGQTASKVYYAAKNDQVMADVVLNNTDAKVQNKEVAISVQAGDVITIVGAGTKPMLRSFKFTVVETESKSWTAAANNVPGGTPDLVEETTGAVVEKELLVADLGSVKFYVGGGSTAAGNTKDSKYKFKEGCLMGDADAESSVGTKLSASRGYETPVAGTYFKWVASEDGVLTVIGDYNGKTASKVYYAAKNGTVMTDVALNDTDAKVQNKEVAISVKAGDEIIIVGAGTKPMLRSFSFTGGGVSEVTAPWTAASIFASPAMTAKADNTKGTITVTVTGVKVGKVVNGTSMTTYADNVTVSMLDKDGDVVKTGYSDVAGSTHSIVITPAASGTYTFKMVAKRAGEDDLASDATASADFILPLAKPAIASASSNGGGAVNVMWGAVAEATEYKIFVKATADAAFPETAAATVAAVDGKATYSYAVSGLTVGTSYDFKVTATRGADTTESDVETAVATAEKVTPWTGVTFGTSATDLSNNVVGPDRPLANYQDPGKTATVNVTVNDNGTADYKAEFKDYAGNDVVKEVKGLTGDLNVDKQVLLSSRDGAGKIKEDEGADGMMFYYTAIPAGTNFTLKADVEVLRWATSNTQNGVGLAAMDRVPAESWTGSASGNSGNYWNNVYYAGAARTSFSIDRKGGGQIYAKKDMGYDSFTKYSYYMGPMSIAKYGIPMTANGAYEGNSGPANYYERRFPLDTRIAVDGVTAKAEGNTNRFNLIGNYTVKPAGFSRMHEQSDFMSKYEMTKFTLQIQKNNTGYISTLWDAEGNLLGQNIDYFVKGAMDLSGDKPYHDDDVTGRKDIPDLQKCLDSDFEYVGFFTSREMDALFTNVELTTIDKDADEPAVAPPTTYIAPSMSIVSGTSSNSAEFKLSVKANVEGTVTVIQNGANVGEFQMKYNALGTVDRLDVPVVLRNGNNNFKVTFVPDPAQVLPAFTELSNTSAISRDCQVKYVNRFANMKNLYVSPTGRDTNYGTKQRPLDVYTAITVVQPGQNIILMDGVYNLDKTIRIERGMNGTEAAPIYFVAEPGAHVVLNGQRKAGSVLVQGSDWWVFKDFEVVGASGVGLQVSGSHNLVQNVKCHDNLSTGLQICTLSSANDIPPTRPTEDKIDGDLEITDWGDWPCYNTILNCESYRNYDAGYDGADGFGAKERCGAGNVFDGCAAYWNADDGWDFYAKTAPDMGPLGRVTIRNCVAFENGYEVRVLVDTKNVIPAFEADGYNAVMNLDADGKVILSEAGNGNGFKMGGSHLPGAHSVTNSFAFYNKAKGIDSNNGPDIKAEGCTSYNNAQENIGMYSNWTPVNYSLKSTVSFKDEKAPVYVDQKEGEIFQMKDGVTEGGTSVIDAETYYAWDGTKSANKSGVEITKDSFVSLDWNSAAWANGALRDADGSLALGDFLKLKDTVTNAGAGELTNDTKPVENPDAVVNPPEEGPQGGGSTGGGGGSTGGNGGTIADKTNGVDKPDDNGIDTSKPASENFGDVEKDSWYEPGITYVVKKGLFQGVAQGVFAPKDNMTRAMLVTVLARLDGQDTTGGDTWYAKGAEWAVAEGVSDGTMLDQNVTREQMVAMLYRYAGSPEVEAEMGMAGFEDVTSISDWAADAMRWAVQNGIINGKDGARLDPQGTATRAEVATILQRFVEKVGK